MMAWLSPADEAADRQLVNRWLESGMNKPTFVKEVGCSVWRLNKALDRLHIPEAVRQAQAQRARESRVGAWRKARENRVRAQVLALEKQDVPATEIARQLRVGTHVVYGVLQNAGIDRHARAKRLRHRPPAQRAQAIRYPRKCTECEWILSTVTVYQEIAVTHMYDDLCFPCWFEATQHKAFTHTNTEDVKEVLALATQYRIAAIETEYEGYRFRSRLEARWAVFLNTLNIKWEYEKEGYRLADGTGYLPDFWLPSLQAWIEIKGNPPSEEERTKAQLLAQGTGWPVFIFVGLPTRAMDQDSGEMMGYYVEPTGEWIEGIVWKRCRRCHAYALVPWDQAVCKCSGSLAEDSNSLHAARNAARAAMSSDATLVRWYPAG